MGDIQRFEGGINRTHNAHHHWYVVVSHMADTKTFIIFHRTRLAKSKPDTQGDARIRLAPFANTNGITIRRLDRGYSAAPLFPVG